MSVWGARRPKGTLGVLLFLADLNKSKLTGRRGIRGTRQGISALSSLVWIPSAVGPIRISLTINGLRLTLVSEKSSEELPEAGSQDFGGEADLHITGRAINLKLHKILLCDYGCALKLLQYD